MRLAVAFFLLISTLLSADIYDEYHLNEDINKSKNYFFSNDFDEIIRFDAVVFEDNNVTVSGSETLKNITQKIKSYENGKRNFFISIIGYTQMTTDDENENSIDSNTYANRIQNIFRDSFDTNQSVKLSRDYAKEIERYLVANGIEKKIIAVEYRGGLDSVFSQESDEGKRANNRVMISLYVEEDLDLDDDGVLNIKDYCPNTKKGIVVDTKGCKFNTIILLADNKKSKNAITVSTKQESITIDKVNDYTFIKSENDKPRVRKSMPSVKLKAIFGDVLATNNVTKFTIYFNNTDFVDGDAQFSKIVDFLSKREDSYIQIIGHTDSKGTLRYNAKLAKTRAEIVAQKIRDSGVKYLHVQVESYGEYNLAVKTADGVSEVLNRRVEILIR